MCACCCSRPARSTIPGPGSCTCRRRSPTRSRTSATTGATGASPSRTWTAGASTARAAGCSAARHRSTAWPTCAATPATTTAGRRAACAAGTTPTSSLTSSAPRPAPRAAIDYRGDSGPLHVATGACRNPLYGAFIEAGRQAGYPLTADMNGYQQEGFAPMDMTVQRRPALERRARVSRSGAAPPEPPRAHRRADLPRTLRRRPRRRRRLSQEGADGQRARRAGGDPCRRRDQLTAAAHALRHRRRRRARELRHSGGRPPAGRRPQPPGPPGDLRPARVHQADLAVRGAKALAQAAHRPGVDPARSAVSAPPAISRRARSSARARASSTPICSTISCRSR